MTKYIVGIAIILCVHFFIKWTDYNSKTITQGIVIDHGTFSYGSAFRSTSARRDIVSFPIAKYKGPETVTKFRQDITQSQFDSIAIEIDKMGSITQSYADVLQQRMVDELRKKYKDSIYIKSEYTTQAPEGAYFFTSHPLGDSIDIIYDQNSPAEGIVYTFFSYWLTLPAISILILFSLLYVGIVIAANARGLR
jgi:hypothetical protein